MSNVKAKSTKLSTRKYYSRESINVYQKITSKMIDSANLLAGVTSLVYARMRVGATLYRTLAMDTPIRLPTLI